MKFETDHQVKSRKPLLLADKPILLRRQSGSCTHSARVSLAKMGN
jgi:hypothetical protein